MFSGPLFRDRLLNDLGVMRLHTIPYAVSAYYKCVPAYRLHGLGCRLVHPRSVFFQYVNVLCASIVGHVRLSGCHAADALRVSLRVQS